MLFSDKSKSTPNGQTVGKSALTSLLSNGATPVGHKTVIGTRRIIMTKGAEGGARVVSAPLAPRVVSAPPPPRVVSAPPARDGPQKVQIIRGPEGQLTVKGLLPGQQLVQMPDGRLHVVMAGQRAPCGQLVAASLSPAASATPSPATPSPAPPSPVTPAPRPRAPSSLTRSR